MKLKARVLSALLAAAMSVTLIGVPVLADGAVLPTADFSLDFSGFSKDSSQASCGITASGAKAQGATVTATAEYLTVNEAKVSPTEGFSYLDFEVKERKDGKNQYGVRVDFQDAFGKKTDGSSEITADFWMNIPGETLTGKYAYYFEFGEDIGGKVNVGLQNLNLEKNRLAALEGNCNGLFIGKNDNGADIMGKWAHWVITQKAVSAEEKDGKAQYTYTTTAYLNGKLVQTNSRPVDAYDANSLFLGVNFQDSDGAGTQKFKMSGFKAYESVLTAEDVAAIYEAEKTPYTTAAEDSLEYTGTDASKALSDNKIVVSFNNFITADYADKVSLIGKDGGTVEINVANEDKNLVITPKTAISAGDYTLKLSENLKSFNDYTLGKALNIPIKLADNLVFALNVGDEITDSTYSGKGQMTVGSAVKVDSFINRNAEKVSYIQFTNNDGNNQTDKISVDFADKIAAAADGKSDSVTVEFWANISDSTNLTLGSAKLFGLQTGNNRVLGMENINTEKQRYSVNYGNTAGIYLGTAENGKDVLDKWSHFVITQEVTENASDNSKRDYKTTVYLNGSQIAQNTAPSVTAASAIDNLQIGHFDARDVVTFKLASFNIYEGINTDILADYEAEKESFAEAPASFGFVKGNYQNALTDKAIDVIFDYPVENADKSLFTLKKDGKSIEIDSVSVSGKTVTISSSAIAEGDYTLTVKKELSSIYGYTLSADVNEKFRLEDGLVFSLDFQNAKKTEQEGDSDGIEELAKVSGATIKSYLDFGSFKDAWRSDYNYAQLLMGSSSAAEARVEVELDNPILSASDTYGNYGGDVTIEFWANVATNEKLPDTSKYAKLFVINDENNKQYMQMEAVGQNTNRWSVSPGDGSQIWIAGSGTKVGDVRNQWAHFVITRKCEYDSTNTDTPPKPYKYTVAAYVNGVDYGERSQNNESRPGAVKKLILGDSGHGADVKVYDFNIYSGVKDADWAKAKYNQKSEIFNAEDYFADGPVKIELDTVSENLLLKGAAVNVKLDRTELDTSKSYRVYIAGYDKNGALVDAKISELLEFVDGKNEITLEYEAGSDDVRSVKAFVWYDDFSPLSKPIEDKTFTVALVGDSITHRSNYSRAIETYYTTRYPDKEIDFVNKGINGSSFDSAVKRFEWDVLNEYIDGLGAKQDYSERPDAVTVMLGVNDIGHGNYAEQEESVKQDRVDKVLTNAEILINKCLDEKLDLTIITPVLTDAKDWSKVTDLKTYNSNEALNRVTAGLKELAKKYEKGGEWNSDTNIGVVDMWTLTTELTQKVRDKNSATKVIMNYEGDTVHPNVDGGFVMGYYFAKENGETPIVASVEINAADKTATAQNADAEIIEASETGVKYTYLAKAIPLPYHSSYKYAEDTLGLSVTEDLNQEIIKVTGLSEGNYTISMDGKALSGTYTADELSKGVNIAIDENNPGQTAAMNAYAEIEKKAQLEVYYRELAASFNGFTSYYPGCYTYDDLKAAIETKWADNADRKTSAMADLERYFGNTTETGMWIYAQKKNQKDGWDLLTGYAAAAKQYATPTEHTVEIKTAE